MADFRSGELWGLGTGSGTGKALTTAYAASDDTDPIIITKPTDLVCVADVQGVAADSVDFRLDVAFSGHTTQQLPVILPVASDRGAVPSVPGTVGAHTIIFHLPWTGPGAAVYVMAKRSGGAAGTLLRLTAHALPAGKGSILGALGPTDAAFDPVTGTVKTSEQAGQETALDGSTLFDVTNGADGTYDYYFEHDERHSFLIELTLNGGSGTVTATLWGAVQDDGTAIAARDYTNVTADFFGVPNFTASDLLNDDAGVGKDFKSFRIRIVAATGGANDADWRGRKKASY